MKTMFIRCMKKAGALVKLKDMTVYSYSPYLQVNAIFGISQDGSSAENNPNEDQSSRIYGHLEANQRDPQYRAVDACS